MPFQGLADGLYLLLQPSPSKGVDHYGILDVGNRLRLPLGAAEPVVVHQTPPAIRTDWLSSTGTWSIIGRIGDEVGAIGRIRTAAADPKYDLFGNNCEHFARFVATGRRESTQLGGFALVAGFATLVWIAVRADAA